jgi:hypothetical protein
MLRRTIATLVAGAALLGATAAQAGTSWSIGINLPPADIVVSNGGRYVEAAPVYYAPAPVYHYAPRPRYVEREVYYAPAPRVVYETSYRDRRWDHRDDRRWGHDRHHRHDHHHRRDDRRDDYGPHRGR